MVTYRTTLPAVTVSEIQKLLVQHEITVQVTKWWNPKTIPSLALRLTKLPFTVYGKGLNTEFALASAYGELMERIQNVYAINQKLQCGILQTPDTIHLAKKEAPQFIDPKLCPPTLITKFLAKQERISATRFVYIDKTQMGIKYLPEGLLAQVAGTNGLCAGNNITEALIQGICEIFERYVLRKLYDNPNIELPIYADDMIRATSVWPYYQELKKMGYQVTVRDCSLNKYPVVGLFLIKGNAFLYNLGAAPNFQMALERCFTEIFQEKDNLEEFLIDLQTPCFRDNVAKKAYWLLQRRKSFVAYKGNLAKKIINTRVVTSNQFISLCGNNQAATLQNLIAFILQQDQVIYLRESSFLGFPALRVYITNLTHCINAEYFNESINIAKAAAIIKNLPQHTENIQFLINTILSMQQHPYLFTDDEKKEYILPILYNALPEIPSPVTIEQVLPRLYSKTYPLPDYFQHDYTLHIANFCQKIQQAMSSYNFDQSNLLSYLAAL